MFLDRDGVLNEDLGYVGRAEQFRWIPGARQAVRRLNDLGWAVIVVTNQSGVARGYFTVDDVEALHAWMQRDLGEAGAHVDAFYYCPFHRDAVIDAFRHPNHPDRKPNPGMIVRALNEHGLDPAASFLIGDKATDMEAAAAAGVRGALFTGGDLDAFVSNLLETGEPGPSDRL